MRRNARHARTNKKQRRGLATAALQEFVSQKNLGNGSLKEFFPTIQD